MKVAIVTCYKYPDYIRARTLRAGLEKINGLDVIVIKNKFKGILRYPEIIIRLIKIRKNSKPDAYLLTFRGQEVLPLVLLIAGRKPVVFDEFIVPLAWATTEGDYRNFKRSLMARLARLSAPFYRYALAACRFILTDNNAHAESSARLSGVNSRQYRVIPLGADETIFKTPEYERHSMPPSFKVFFYGSALPMDGLDYVIEAAELLKDKSSIHFSIVGGGRAVKTLVEEAKSSGANVNYRSRLKLAEVPNEIDSAQLCLAGPFGDTPQAQQVIIGKTFQFLACSAPTLVGENEISQRFENRINSLTVPQANAKALADAVLWAHEHPEKLKEIGRQGRSLYDESFSSQVISKELKNLIDELN